MSRFILIGTDQDGELRVIRASLGGASEKAKEALLRLAGDVHEGYERFMLIEVGDGDYWRWDRVVVEHTAKAVSP